MVPREDALEVMQFEQETLRAEVRVAREAAEITARLVAQQFEETDRVLNMFQSSNAQRKAVLDAATGIAIISVGLDGVVQLFNTGAENMLGYRADEIVDMSSITSIFPPEELAEYGKKLAQTLGRKVEGSNILFELVKDGQRHEAEWNYMRKDNTRLPVALTITAITNTEGRVMGLLCVAVDLTQRKQWEKEVLEAKEAAEAANRTKSSFLANMSHELRTPLNAVIGYSEILQEEAEESGVQKFIPDLQKINAAGKHLLSLINDILDLSKIEAGRVELFLESFSLANVIQEVVSTVQPLVAKNANELVVEMEGGDPGSVHSDITRIRQVMFNLLSNASKFTEKGKIFLKVGRVMDRGSEKIRIAVRDTGVLAEP